MREAFSNALVLAAKADPRVLLLTGDHGYALFDAFRKACPDQYINCGIAEQNMVGVAAGLAKSGFLPVVYGLAAFVPIRVLEQIKIDVCYAQLPVVFIGDGAGLVYSHLGTSHQSTEDIACTRVLPHLMVLSPADRHEMTACMDLALRSAEPVYLRMGKSDRGDVHHGPIDLRPGELVPVTKDQKRIVMLATGSMVKAACDLAPDFDAEVWSVPSVKPLSTQTLTEIARRAEKIITLEEHSTMGGLGAAVTEAISATCPVPVCRIGIQDRYSTTCGTWNHLLQEHGLNHDAVKKQIHEFLRS